MIVNVEDRLLSLPPEVRASVRQNSVYFSGVLRSRLLP